MLPPLAVSLDVIIRSIEKHLDDSDRQEQFKEDDASRDEYAMALGLIVLAENYLCITPDNSSARDRVRSVKETVARLNASRKLDAP